MICFPLNNTEYAADALGAWFATRTRGVFCAENNFKISTNNNNLTVTISGGIAWLKMAEYWGVVVNVPQEVTFSFRPSDTIWGL